MNVKNATQNIDRGELHAALKFALQQAVIGGDTIFRHFGKVSVVDATSSKTATHWRTIVDTENRDLIIPAIKKAYPEYSIHSEESAGIKRDSPFIWILDELDGTLAFMRQMSDHCGVCLALAYERVPVVGAVVAPLRKEIYAAAQGFGATLNGATIAVNSVTNINQVVMGIDSGKNNRTAHLPFVQRALAPNGISCDVRYACASLPLCFVACGRIDAYLATSLEPEDMAAAVILIREAGGVVTNLKGEEWNVGDPSILAANPVLHAKLLSFFATEISAFGVANPPSR